MDDRGREVKQNGEQPSNDEEEPEERPADDLLHAAEVDGANAPHRIKAEPHSTGKHRRHEHRRHRRRRSPNTSRIKSQKSIAIRKKVDSDGYFAIDLPSDLVAVPLYYSIVYVALLDYF